MGVSDKEVLSLIPPGIPMSFIGSAKGIRRFKQNDADKFVLRDTNTRNLCNTIFRLVCGLI